MGKLVEGDDGLLAEEVGEWIADKHELLCDYVQITTYTRKKYLPPQGRGGATYIDLFSGPGRARIKNTTEFVDGSCVAAWRKSCDSGHPFSCVIIGDADQERLEMAKERLERLEDGEELLMLDLAQGVELFLQLRLHSVLIEA